jgi:hypothetical protein
MGAPVGSFTTPRMRPVGSAAAKAAASANMKIKYDIDRT